MSFVINHLFTKPMIFSLSQDVPAPEFGQEQSESMRINFVAHLLLKNRALIKNSVEPFGWQMISDKPLVKTLQNQYSRAYIRR
jgi:hypothetical protein